MPRYFYENCRVYVSELVGGVMPVWGRLGGRHEKMFWYSILPFLVRFLSLSSFLVLLAFKPHIRLIEKTILVSLQRTLNLVSWRCLSRMFFLKARLLWALLDKGQLIPSKGINSIDAIQPILPHLPDQSHLGVHPIEMPHRCTQHWRANSKMFLLFMIPELKLTRTKHLLISLGVP